MGTDIDTTEALLQITQWLSPAFPVGGYAYSHGLEAAIAAEEVCDAEGLERWLRAVLEHGSGRNDAILLCHALRAPDRAEALAGLAEALATSRERWTETREQGAAFAGAVNALTGSDRPARPLPVALGEAAAGLGLAPAQVAALYLHAFTSNLVSAGIRFIPLGQTEGQAVLARLKRSIVVLAETAEAASLDDLGGAAFGADLAAMRHETLEVRLFKS